MEYTAIILRNDPFRESDRTITMFTLEDGLVRLIAKGSQKIMSKNATSLETGVLSIVGVAHGKELSYVTSAYAESYFSAIRSDIVKSASVLYISHLFARVFREYDAHEQYWYTYRSWLEALCVYETMTLTLVDAIVLRMLSALGFTPDLSPSGVAFRISVGRTVTLEEAKQALAQGEQVIRVDAACLEVLRSALSDDWDTVQSLSVDADTATTVHRIVYAYVEYQLERPLTDWERMIYSFT